jgi:transposase
MAFGGGEAADREFDIRAGCECGAGGACQRGDANQVFKWRRALERGELVEAAEVSTASLPVTLSSACETAIKPREARMQEQPPQRGSIHIELPGRAMISVECGADPVLLRSVLESLRK